MGKVPRAWQSFTTAAKKNLQRPPRTLHQSGWGSPGSGAAHPSCISTQRYTLAAPQVRTWVASKGPFQSQHLRNTKKRPARDPTSSPAPTPLRALAGLASIPLSGSRPRPAGRLRGEAHSASRLLAAFGVLVALYGSLAQPPDLGGAGLKLNISLSLHILGPKATAIPTTAKEPKESLEW